MEQSKNFLRCEALCWFVASLFFYIHLGTSWWLFAILFFMPDFALLAYLIGPKFGAICYNLFHTFVIPLILIPFFPAITTIWICHIGFDRMLGIGLKLTKGFKFTHLGEIGYSKM